MPSPKADESDGMPSWLREARDALPATALPAPTPQTDDTAISGVISGAELSRLLEEQGVLQALLHEQHEVQQETLRQLVAAKEHAATEAQRLLDAHQVAHRAAVSLRQSQIHSVNSHCACAQNSIEALTTREAALRSEVALLETEHAVKVEAL